MSKDTFTKRRNSLMSVLGEGMFVMGGAVEQTRNSDVHYSFRQNSDWGGVILASLPHHFLYVDS